MAVTQSTTQIIRFAAAADAITTKVYIQKIRWVKPTTAAHSLIIKDTAGTVMLDATASAANVDQEYDFRLQPLLADGVSIDTLGSGKVDIYII